MKTFFSLLMLAPRHYSCSGTHATNFLRPAIIADARNSAYDPVIKIALLNDLSSRIVFHSWAPNNGCDIAQMYHALRLLSCCTAVYDDTLCACYYVANPNLDDNARRYLSSLADSGIPDVLRTRNNILSHSGTNIQTISNLAERAALHHVKVNFNPLTIAS